VVFRGTGLYGDEIKYRRMMMKKGIGFVSVLLAIAFLLGSCTNILSPPDKRETVPPGKGRLTIHVEDGARTALPSGTFDEYVLKFTYTGGTEGYTHSDETYSNSNGISVDLEPGDWTVDLEAKIGSTISGQGSAAVTVSAETVTPITIRIGIYTGTGEAQGTLKYTVTYPTTGTYDTHTLTVRDTAGLTVGSPETITNGTEGSVQLDPGVYFVGVVINDMVKKIGAARTSVVHIYGGRETLLPIDIADEEFTALVPITVTADLTDSTGLVSRRMIAAYGNAAGTEALGNPEPVYPTTGSGIITLWVSSEEANVYIRQYVELAGETFNGHLEPVTMTGVGTAVSFADTLYAVSPDTGISDGTVTTTTPGAFGGNTVGVAFEPDTGYTLKTGSLIYSYVDSSGGTPVSVDNSVVEIAPNEYEFIMPAFDVTVSAFFNKFLGFTIEQPQEETIAITTVHSAGSTPPTEISWTAAESVTFTVDSSDYTVEDGNLKWFVNGTEITTGSVDPNIMASGSSLTLNAKAYIQRSYAGTVMIEANGQWYSTDISFKVTQ
jgi:hypothetical protein